MLHLKGNDAAELGHGLDLHDARHDGAVREVAGELRLVCGDAFDPDSHFAGNQLQDLIDEEEGISARGQREAERGEEGVCERLFDL